MTGKSRSPTDVSALIEWIASNPMNVGLVVLSADSPDAPLVSLNALLAFPLASTKKVLILGAYATAVAAGRLDPDRPVTLSALERWYWPGTDGGSHPRAVSDWAARGRIIGRRADRSVELSDLAWAMVRWSDNAAADYLLDLVGAQAVADFADSADMAGQEQVYPLLGAMLAWSHQPAEWLGLDPSERAARAWRLAAASTGSRVARPALPRPSQQFLLADADTAGRPMDWARLMLRIGQADSPATAPAVAAIMRANLDWPRIVFSSNQERFSAFYTKGGSLAGVVTEAAYLRPKAEGAGLAVAIFFRSLDRVTWSSMRNTFVWQHLIVGLATNQAVLDQLIRVLT